MVSIEREELLPMNVNEIERIVIRHVSGSKANQIEQIPFINLTEITIGRDPSSNIAFDSPRDDIVSRRHAVIRPRRSNLIPSRRSW
jgi:serine protease Do